MCEENVGDKSKINEIVGNSFKSPEKVFTAKFMRAAATDASCPGAENIRTSYCKEQVSSEDNNSTVKGQKDMARDPHPMVGRHAMVSHFGAVLEEESCFEQDES